MSDMMNILCMAAIGGSCLFGVSDAMARQTRTQRQLLKGGRVVAEGEFPGVVGVRSVASLGGADNLCTGALIAPNLVVTARHCVAQASGCGSFGADFDKDAFLIVAAQDLAAPKTAAHVLEVDEVRVTEDDAVCGNDIALLILTENALASVATPMSVRHRAAPIEDESYTAVGYGDTRDDTEQPFLMRALDGQSVRCVGEDCSRNAVRDREFFGGDGLCNGDSGGPAIDGQGRVFGVASRILRGNCSETIYTDLSAYSEFLVDGAEAAAAAGGYAVPAWAMAAPVDTDEDGVPDPQDVCPMRADPDQADLDGDGQGDACDEDVDGDGATNAQDNCPLTPNPEQRDADGDAIGDACDLASVQDMDQSGMEGEDARDMGGSGNGVDIPEYAGEGSAGMESADADEGCSHSGAPRPARGALWLCACLGVLWGIRRRARITPQA